MRVRPKLRYLVPAAIAVPLVWAAAPALSASPYLPPAVDFEQALTGVAKTGNPQAARTKSGEGPVTYLSEVIEAPERFDLAGLAGERRELELRARESGGEWTGWTETANGDPVWFGGADEIQVRSRGAWRPEGSLHYVNVSGTTGTADTLLTGFRRAVNSGFVAAAGLVDPEAAASPARPAVVPRSEWGATRAKGGCRPREAPERGVVKAAVVHHTVTASGYSEAEAPSLVLGICRYHRNANGWNDIGYNALVDRFGNVYAGRSGGLRKPIIGAHAQGFNAQTTGVASIGTHTATGITPAALNAFADFLAWKLSAHLVPAIGKTTLTSAGGAASRYPKGARVRLDRIIGHGRVGETACPGDALNAQLRQIRIAAQERMDAEGGGTEPPPTTPTAPPADGSVELP